MLGNYSNTPKMWVLVELLYSIGLDSDLQLTSIRQHLLYLAKLKSRRRSNGSGDGAQGSDRWTN